MEALVKYVANNREIQDHIISSNSDDFIESIYRLFLHYGCSLEYFIKAGVRYELTTQGEYNMFRESRKINSIMTDFFCMYGGNFNVVTTKIRSIAMELEGGRSEKNLKRAVEKCIDFIDKTLSEIVTDCLVDFCNDVSRYIHNPNIIGSFVFFRILAVKIIQDISSEERLHVMPVIKIINKIASGDLDLGGIGQSSQGTSLIKSQSTMKKFVNEQNCRFRSIMTRLMEKHQVNYLFIRPMNCINYAVMTEKFLKNMAKFKDQKCVVPKNVVRTLSYYQISLRDKQPDIVRSSTSETLSNSGLRPELLELIIKHALKPQRPTMFINNIYYFLLWSDEDLMKIVSLADLDVQFFSKWRLNGEKFIHLNEDVLKIMGLTDEIMINKIMSCIRDIQEHATLTVDPLKDKGIAKWSINDVCIWLIISNMSHLVDIFKTQQIDGLRLTQMTIHDFHRLGINHPSDLLKIHTF